MHRLKISSEDGTSIHDIETADAKWLAAMLEVADHDGQINLYASHAKEAKCPLCDLASGSPRVNIVWGVRFPNFPNSDIMPLLRQVALVLHQVGQDQLASEVDDILAQE